MKQKLLVAALGMALVAPLAAHAEGGYIGVNVGNSDQKFSAEGDSETISKTGYKLYGGFDFTKNFGIEGGYVDFGKVSTSYTVGGDSVSASAKPTAAYVAATGTLPLNEQFSVFGKVGVSFNQTKFKVAVNSDSDSATDNRSSLLLGIGAAYNFTKNFAVVAEYENFGKVVKADDASLKIDLFSVGLRYKF